MRVLCHLSQLGLERPGMAASVEGHRTHPPEGYRGTTFFLFIFPSRLSVPQRRDMFYISSPGHNHVQIQCLVKVLAEVLTAEGTKHR